MLANGYAVMEVNEQWFKDNIYSKDVIVPMSLITFNGRYSTAIFTTRHTGLYVGKTIADMWGIEPEKYFKLVLP